MFDVERHLSRKRSTDSILREAVEKLNALSNSFNQILEGLAHRPAIISSQYINLAQLILGRDLSKAAILTQNVDN